VLRPNVEGAAAQTADQKQGGERDKSDSLILIGGHQEGAWDWARGKGWVVADGQSARSIVTMDGDTLAWRFGGFTQEGES